MVTKLTFLSVLAASTVLIGSGAQAATLSGTFDVRVVNYATGGGSSSNSLANETNFDTRYNSAADGVNRDTFTYTGDLDFFIDNLNPTNGDGETVADFFLQNGTNTPVGTVTGLDATVGGLQLSKPTFAITTLFEFTEVYSNSFETRVTHDDGFSIYDDGNLLFGYANPTGIRTTPGNNTTKTFSGGEFKLIYAAANGNPSKLLVEGDGVPAIPLPASSLLLLGGLGAFGALRRKKSRS